MSLMQLAHGPCMHGGGRRRNDVALSCMFSTIGNFDAPTPLDRLAPPMIQCFLDLAQHITLSAIVRLGTLDVGDACCR